MARAIYAVTMPVALVIWGMGLFWLVIAIGSVIKVDMQENRFCLQYGLVVRLLMLLTLTKAPMIG
jgi:tellurite resistance protein TehA-like permease